MKRHNRLKKHTLGLAAALLVTAGMSQIALAGDSVYVLSLIHIYRAENFTRFAKAILPKEVKDTKQINIEEY